MSSAEVKKRGKKPARWRDIRVYGVKGDKANRFCSPLFQFPKYVLVPCHAQVDRRDLYCSITGRNGLHTGQLRAALVVYWALRTTGPKTRNSFSAWRKHCLRRRLDLDHRDHDWRNNTVSNYRLRPIALNRAQKQ